MIVTDFLQFLIFPGLVLTIYLAIFYSWFFRKTMARIENRVGPPFNQPAYDLAKLMAKERIYPQGTMQWVAKLLPRLQVGIGLFMSFFIPIVDYEGLISFEGDVYVFIFLLALHGSTAFFVGWASRNPYTVNGAGRAVLTEISLEIPLALSLAGMSIMTGSMRISEMTKQLGDTIFDSGYSPLFLIPWVILFIVMIYSTLGALEFNPFSAAHAETEIVGGWNTELSGSDLAMTKLAEIINLFNLSGLIAAVFLGGPISVVFSTSTVWTDILSVIVALGTFVIKVGFITFLLAFVATTSSRLRIDQITDSLWTYFLPTAMIAILFILGIKTLGGN